MNTFDTESIGRAWRSVNSLARESAKTRSKIQASRLRIYHCRAVSGGLEFIAALIDDDSDRHQPTAWNAAAQTFITPDSCDIFDWEGNCVAGPCSRGLNRYPLRIEGGKVVVDLSTRLPGKPVGDAIERMAIPHPPLVPGGTR